VLRASSSRVALVLALLISTVANSGCDSKKESNHHQLESRDHDALQFAGKLSTGDYVALHDYRGKLVLANVWATWCSPCKRELPELARLHRDYESKGFMVLGVNVDSDSAVRKVQGAIRKYDLPYPNILDSNSSSTEVFGVQGYPTSVLLDRSGKVIWRRLGGIRKQDADLLQAIEGSL